MTPDSPPMTKITRPPVAKRPGVEKRILPAAMVAIQAKTWMPAGTLTAMEAALK
ncbi:hypothetical protein D3C80_2100460 [compost metagenome]